MVEIVVAMTLFAVVATVAAGVLLKVGSANRDAVQRTTATNLAAEQIESIRSTDAVDIPDGGVSRTVTRGTTTYTIRQTANYLSSGANVSICNGSGDALAYKLVTVTVRWPNMGSTQPVRADTLKTLGVGSQVSDATKGALAISVQGALALPADGVTVTLNPGGLSRTTGEDGCAVFIGLNAGTYSVTMNMAGYVSQANSQSSTVGGLGVVAGRVMRGTALYAPGRTYRIAPDVPVGYTLLPGVRYNYATPYLGARVVPTCTEVPAGASCLAATGEFQKVFPTVNDVWIGTCADSRAAQQSVDLAAGAAAAVQTLTLPTGLVDVRALRSGSPVTGVQLYAVHAPEALDATAYGCTTGVSYALPVTSSSGGSFTGTRVALPPGTWTIQNTPTYSVPAPAGSVEVTVGPGNPGTAEVIVP